MIIDIFNHFSEMENDEKIFLKTFCERLRNLRLERNLSQEMLANDANIPINQIGRIERAEIATSLSTLFKISKALNISLQFLFPENS